MTTRFSMTRDINGYNGFGRQTTDLKYGVTLSAGAEQHITIPAATDGQYRNYLAIFSVEAGGNIWVALNDTADLPTATLAAINSELNPIAYYIKGDGEQVLSLITSDTTASMGVVLYAVS